MYCTIKYIDYEQYQNQELLLEDTDSRFSHVDFENSTLLINPDCPIGILRDYIYSSLHLYGEDGDNFELCTEKAVLLKTKECEPTKSGLDVLTKKETYYIVLLDNDQSEPPKTLVPMLNRLSKEYMDFLSRQRKKSLLSKASLTKSSSRRIKSKPSSLLSSRASSVTNQDMS